MPYRESFAWAIIPLFDNSISATSGGCASPNCPVASTASMSGSSSHEVALEPIAKIMLEDKLAHSSGGSVVVEISNLNKVKESYTEDSLQVGQRSSYILPLWLCVGCLYMLASVCTVICVKYDG